MKPKTRKGAVKRIKVTNGGDLSKGKLLVNRTNDNHRLIKKQRERMLKSKKAGELSSIFNKLKAIM
ncbi:MAG: 50S ribosomal protein L35 [candidate division SR1 bacterium]|nr:50S ribosomal protein L35 [candidate division SR1 bacterium]